MTRRTRITATPAQLYARANRVAALLDTLPRLADGADLGPSEWVELRKRFRARCHEIAAELRATDATDPDGVRITEAPERATVRMLGITTTSTSGLSGALRNWKARARAEAEWMENGE